MGLFKKPLYETRIELLCQNTGVTFHVNTHQAHKSFTCRHCGRESWIVNLKEGFGNINVTYIGADQSERPLHKVIPEKQFGLAQYEADSGTFVLISQEKP